MTRIVVKGRLMLAVANHLRISMGSTGRTQDISIVLLAIGGYSVYNLYYKKRDRLYT